MNRNIIIPGLVALLLACFSITPAMANWDWAIGVASVDIGSDLGDIIDDGFGLSLGGSNRFSKSMAFEFLWDLSFHDTLIGPSADITYSRYDIGLRFFPMSGSSAELYASAGLALHFLRFVDFVDEIDGMSLYYGGGVELAVGRSGALDLGFRYSDWKGDWSPGGPNIDTTTTAIEAVYRFKY